jgi:hypothetical protein
MKTNWYSLAAFAAVVAAIVCAHIARLDALYTVLLSAALPIIPAMLPALFAKGGDK